MNDMEKRRRRIELAVKVLALPVIGFFIAPFVFVAIGGMIGGLVALVIGLLCVFMTPWLGMKLANWRLKSIKAEAMKNPIETMENEHKAKVEILGRMKESIRTFFASVQSFHDKLAGFKEQFPQDSKQFDDQYKAMVQLLNMRKAKYNEAKRNLSQFESVINRAKAIWAMAQEAAKMRKSAGADVEAFYSRLKTETALDSVTSSMNSAFADLELALMDESPVAGSLPEIHVVAEIPEQTGPPTLELDFDNEPELVRVETR